MATFEFDCPSCGRSVQEGWSFCMNNQCRAPLAGVRRVCQACHALTPATATACPHCNAPFAKTTRSFVLARWEMRQDEVARRLVHRDLGSVLEGKVEVNRDTRALLFLDGRFVKDLGPGPTVLDESEKVRLTSGERAGRALEVVFTPTGDLELDGGDHSLVEAFSADPLRVTVRSTVIVRVEDPTALVTNLFRDLNVPALSCTGLANHLQPELRQAIQDTLANIRFEARAADLPKLREELAAAVLARLSTSLTRYGLRAVRFRLIEIAQADLERITGKKAQTFVLLREKEQATEAGRLLFEATNQATRQELYQRDQKLKSDLEAVDLLERENQLMTRKQHNVLLSAETLDRLAKESQGRRDALDLSLATDAERKRIEASGSLAELRRKLEQDSLDDETRRRLMREFIATEIEMKTLDLRLKMRKAQFDAEYGERVALAKVEEGREEAKTQRWIDTMKVQAENLAQIKGAKADADVKRMQAAKGLDAAQIIALFGDRAPGAMDALKAWSNQASDKEKFELVQKHQAELVAVLQKAATDQKELLQQVLGVARDAAVAAASSRAPAPSLHSWWHCHVELPTTIASCPKCGARMVTG